MNAIQALSLAIPLLTPIAQCFCCDDYHSADVQIELGYLYSFLLVVYYDLRIGLVKKLFCGKV